MANYIRHGKTTGATNGRKNCRRETRLRKIREAKRALEARAREKAAHRIRRNGRTRISTTAIADHAGRHGMTQGYNAQAAVESSPAGVEESLP